MGLTIETLLDNVNLPVLPLTQSQSLWQAGDTEEQKLYNLLVPFFPTGNVYPDTAHAKRTYPDCVYSLSDAGAAAWRGVDISHSVVFGLSIRDVNRADLAVKAAEVAASLHSQAGVSILGRASAYEQELNCYVIALEVLTAVPVGFDLSADQPFSLLLLPGKEFGREPHYDNCGPQIVDREHHIIYHAATMGDLKAQREQVQQAIHWQSLCKTWSPLIFKSGEPIQADGGLLAWVDVWQDSKRIIPEPRI